VTSSNDPVETELKFALGAGAREALLAGLLRDAESADLVATYFDTCDLALFRHGYGLRVRRKGGRFVQTLKSDGDGLFARGEWESAVPTAGPDAAALAATPVAALGSIAALAPVFRVEVRRTSAVFSHGSARIEASLDIGHVRAGECHEAIEELELELLEGDPRDLFAFARTLDLPLVLAFETKSERGYRLVHGAASRTEGPQASFRRLSTAVLGADAAGAIAAADELGLAAPRPTMARFDRTLWARVLLDAAERAARLPGAVTRV
jgi:triphosphatase